MSKLFVVRHGQASFFTDDYDKLSPMGEEQSRVLGRYWVENGITIDEVYSGDLKRQVRTAECVGEIYAEKDLPWPEHQIMPALNEYPSDVLMKEMLPHLKENSPELQKLDHEFQNSGEGRERYRTFHRLLEAVMEKWVHRDYEIDGLPEWSAFSGGVRNCLKEIREKPGSGRNVAVFSSGGPVGVSVQTVLEAPDIKAAELNWRVHNASVTEFTFSANRVALDAFNSIPHLTDPEMLTYR
jgi:broad specificity phosphatase PhoE